MAVSAPLIICSTIPSIKQSSPCLPGVYVANIMAEMKRWHEQTFLLNYWGGFLGHRMSVGRSYSKFVMDNQSKIQDLA